MQWAYMKVVAVLLLLQRALEMVSCEKWGVLKSGLIKDDESSEWSFVSTQLLNGAFFVEYPILKETSSFNFDFVIFGTNFFVFFCSESSCVLAFALNLAVFLLSFLARRRPSPFRHFWMGGLGLRFQTARPGLAQPGPNDRAEKAPFRPAWPYAHT